MGAHGILVIVEWHEASKGSTLGTRALCGRGGTRGRSDKEGSLLPVSEGMRGAPKGSVARARARMATGDTAGIRTRGPALRMGGFREPVSDEA